jgi:hypothetical protein
MKLKGIWQRKTVNMMNVRKIPLIIALTIMTIFCSMFTVYMTMFNHGPASEILEANRQVVRKSENSLKLHSEEEMEEETESESVLSAKKWQKFVDDNKFVAIGDVYNSCGEFSYQSANFNEIFIQYLSMVFSICMCRRQRQNHAGEGNTSP